MQNVSNYIARTTSTLIYGYCRKEVVR